MAGFALPGRYRTASACPVGGRARSITIDGVVLPDRQASRAEDAFAGASTSTRTSRAIPAATSLATFGQPRTRRVHAIQLEINASLLMTTSRDEFIAHISRGGIPEKANESIARLRRCLREALAALPSVLVALHES